MCTEFAQKVVDILDQMEHDGRLIGLPDDSKEIERQIMGMRIRSKMKCPEKSAKIPPKLFDKAEK